MTQGEIDIRIHFEGTKDEYDTAKDGVSGLLKDHEQLHVNDTKKLWNEFVTDVEWLRGKNDDWYVASCDAKAKLASNYFIARTNLFYAQALKASCDRDKNWYLTNLEFLAKHRSYNAAHLRRCKDADPDLEKHQNTYTSAKNTMDKFKCPGESSN
jgi:hypothetical protein